MASSGVFHPRVLRGRWFISRATSLSSVWLMVLRSVPLGKNWRELSVGVLVAAALPFIARQAIASRQRRTFSTTQSAERRACGSSEPDVDLQPARRFRVAGHPLPGSGLLANHDMRGSLPRSQVIDRRSAAGRRFIWRVKPSSAASAVQPRVLRYNRSPGSIA